METTSRRVAIYARFSSSRQDERSIDDQVRRCREYVEQHHNLDATEVFVDSAVSGASLDRRGFEAMMAAVDAGLVSTIITEDISRISRDFADAAQVFKRLQYARVPLIGIADGIDTSAKHAKLTFTLKSLVADLYLDDLRDKTLRGMEGRALAGYATGTVPFGFRTRPALDGTGRELGKQIVIDETAARIVVRIFTEYVEGRSMSWIARKLNLEGIPSPRAKMRHRFAGWSVGSVREMLRNERYIGVWRFKTMQWVKVPGSNRRLPRKRSASQVITHERPHLQIVELPLWQAAHVRIAAGHPLSGRPRARSRYVLSGAFVCAQCNAPMTISGGSGPDAYYHCSTHRMKGLCSNAASLRASPFLRTLFEAVRVEVAGATSVREAIATQNGRREDVIQKQFEEASSNLAATEAQIDRLLEFVAAGERFEYVFDKMRTLELTARMQKAELEALRGELKRQPRKVALADIDAAVSRIAEATPDESEASWERLKRWLGRSIAFDGTHVEVTLNVAAMVGDVARDGAVGPHAAPGAVVAIRVSVRHAIARGTPRVESKCAVQSSTMSIAANEAAVGSSVGAD